MSPFDPAKRLLVLGDVFVDYHLDKKRVRLGGVFHAARTLQAISANYSAAYISPTYLESSISRFLKDLGVSQFARAGEVNGSPSVILIRDSVEAGDLGYDEILRKQREVTWNKDAILQLLDGFAPTDMLVFPGNYPYKETVSLALSRNIRVHIDAQYDDDIAELSRGLDAPLTTLFISTSASIFGVAANGSPARLRELLPPSLARQLVLKENRGGSRVFSGLDEEADASAFLGHAEHSVGVGDCFDCVWILSRDEENPKLRLARASYYASIYASTMLHEDFVSEVQGARVVDASIGGLRGTRVPWEKRAATNIYIAAPDFPSVDTKAIDGLESALRYHGFSPHRPIKENGLHTHSASESETAAMYQADRDLLRQCSILIAMPLVDDPGTFVELGMFVEMGKPAILFDAEGWVDNMFARRSATRVCRSLGETIRAVFEIAGFARD
ncbi:nucleoside 2-deoxyribosyltransferase [Myxococcus stipitatus]|uniref:nucleoside 2-deoxyribosyltransferase n=1 Tax=Myxococcus stipitatus TaxID=83455 RepID=UPI001F1F7872|nr:nucleoside 2-deoxyribosyltransferase [Myxococcus stipitatus]MCE9673882.1 nucleoside 2-deoxyribosyltransferase [Myxococcus stipitatus]